MDVRKRRWRLPAAIAVSAALILGGSMAAIAAVSGTPNANGIGMAGYNSMTTDPHGFTDVQDVQQPNQYGLTIASGRQGVQLCNATTGATAKLGLLSDNLNTNYDLQYAVAVAPGCPANGPLTGTDFPGLTAVPFGHHVWKDIAVVKTTHRVRLLICVIHRHVIVCRVVVRVRTRNTLVFSAQDLDAPTATPVTGDLPGVQTVTVRIPRSTVFDNASWGVNANTTALVPCSGGGFPVALTGPAAYTSAACQTVGFAGFATATIGAGLPQDPTVLDTTEMISPATGAATMAPNNSLLPSTLVPGYPHGTASNASTAGGSFTTSAGNAPVS